MYTACLKMHGPDNKANRGGWHAAVCCVAFIGFLSAGAMCFSQEAATADGAFAACASDIDHAPQDAYDSCARYVQESNSENPENLKKAKDWLEMHAAYKPYVRYVQSLTPDDKAKFIVYEPDMTIELPQLDEKDALGSVRIARKFGNLSEEGMLRKAEAVYPGPAEMLHMFFVNWAGWPGGQSGPMKPFWGVPERRANPDASVVTASAVRYYYEARLDFARDPKLGPVMEVSRITMDYDGVIRHFDHYVHAGASFEDAYVADLTLTWDFHCGGLCGGGFKRNKVVVLDRRGDVSALFMDAPENSETTFY